MTASKIDTVSIQRAAEFLRGGKLVAFPTETVYGLGGNALDDAAVAGIYEAKGRPSFNPLIVHVSSMERAKEYAQFTTLAEHLAKQFWPGPLTLVLQRMPHCPLSLLVSAGLDTVALRVPGHEMARALLAASQLPIAAPSANRSGRISPTCAQHVKDELHDRVAMILDGGACMEGIESTVVDARGEHPIILRPGSVTAEMIGGRMPEAHGHILSPGQMKSHYAPDKAIRLNATDIREGEGLLAFGEELNTAKAVRNLSLTQNLKEAAANLFRMLRELDASDASSIAVMPIPNEGLGVAINDRLQRAAAPRN